MDFVDVEELAERTRSIPVFYDFLIVNLWLFFLVKNCSGKRRGRKIIKLVFQNFKIVPKMF